MCMDKGHDFLEVYELLLDHTYTIHIPIKNKNRDTDTKK